MKAALRNFVAWMEESYRQGTPARPSPFELALDPDLLAKAEAAIDQAKSAPTPVVGVPQGISSETLAAGLVWKRSGISSDRIYRGDLSPEEFDRLIKVVEDLVATGVRLEESTTGPIGCEVAKAVQPVIDEPQ